MLDTEKTAKALELRKSGATYEQIKQALGFRTRDGAHKCVMRGLETMLQEPAEAVLKLELARLDKMLLGLMKKGALDGDPSAVRAAIRIMDRRAKYLGLDSAVSRPEQNTCFSALNGRSLADALDATFDS